MPIIITITNEPINFDGSLIYNYSDYDRILKNIFKNEYEVFYSGQNRGKMDYQLINAIENNDLFKIYYRPKKSMSYTYLGYTINSSIIQYRKVPLNTNTSTEERLQIHLVVKNIENCLIPTNNFSGSGKYKKDLLVHAGLRDQNDNSILQHNKNTNIGFYYYSDN